MSETIWPLFDVCLNVESNTCPNMKRRHEMEPFWIIKSSKFYSRRQFWSTLYWEFCWFDHSVAGSFIRCWEGRPTLLLRDLGNNLCFCQKQLLQVCYGARSTKQLKHMGRLVMRGIWENIADGSEKVNMKSNLVMFLGFLCVLSATLFRIKTFVEFFY